MGGSTIRTDAPRLASLRLQTSCYGRAVPWMFGKPRVQPNLVHYADFTAIPHTSTTNAGKGGGVKQQSTTYTYTVAAIMVLGAGPAVSIDRIWRGKSIFNAQSLGLDFYAGTSTQNPSPYFTSKHSADALGYRGLSYVTAGAYNLGDSDTIEQHSFEVQMPNAVAANVPDANIKDVITALLTDAEQGLGLPASSIGSLTNFSNFCLANELWVSPCYTEQKAAYEHVRNLLQIGFSDCVYSGGQFKIVPYSDAPASSAYGSFTPNVTPVYELTHDDFLDGGDAITLSRKSQNESFNHVQIRFNDRLSDYNESIAEAKDQADIEQYGLRTMPQVDLTEIADKSVAQQVADFLLHRSLNVRNVYEFKLPWSYVLLEPMDLVTLTYPRLNLNATPVLITEITEDADGVLSVKAEEYPLNSNRASKTTAPPSAGYSPNNDSAPGNALAPVIFDAPLQLTNGEPQLWLATAGGANWGGCDVWVSTDDVSYRRAGRLSAKSRYGTTVAPLALGATTDTLNTLAVDVSAANATLVSATEQDAQDLLTVCYVGGEFLAYKTADLVGIGKYNLSYLVRGAYGSEITTHAANSSFVRLDESLFKYPYSADWLGKPIFIKLASFNTVGGGAQDLASAPKYTHVIAGAALATVANLRMATSWTLGKDASVLWDVLDGADSYDLQIIAGSSVVRTLTGITSNQYTYTPQDAQNDGGPWRQIIIKVRGRSIVGRTGAWAQIIANNPQCFALQSITVDAAIKSAYLKITHAAEADFAGVIVWMSADPACAAIDENKVFDGADTFITLNKLRGIGPLVGGTTYYVRAAAYDTFGKDALNVSAASSFVALDISDIATNLGTSNLQASLSEKIGLIDAPVSTASSVAARIAASDAARDAAIAAQAGNATAALNAATANQQAALQNETNARVAAVQAEAQTRANAVLAEAAARDAAITVETNARTAADSTLIQQITTLTAAQVSDKSVLTAAIQTEQTARTNADTANAASITALASTVASNRSTTDARITTVEQTASTASAANAAKFSSIDAKFSNASAAVSSLVPDSNLQISQAWRSFYGYDLAANFVVDSEGTRFKSNSGGGACWNYSTAKIFAAANKKYRFTAKIRTNGGNGGNYFVWNNNDTGAYGYSVITAAIGSAWTDVSADVQIVGNISPGFAINNGGAAGYSEICNFQFLDVTNELEIATTNATIVNNQSAQATINTSTANSIAALTAQQTTARTNATAAVTSASTASIERDNVLSTRLDTMSATQTSDKSDLNAAITSAESASITRDAALGSRVDAVQATANTDRANAAAANQSLQNAMAQVDAALATSIDELAATVTANNTTQTAAIQGEQSVRATAIGAVASQLTTVQTTVDGHTASLQYGAQAINGLNAQYTVKIDNNGYVGGYGLASSAVNGATVSSFIINVDKFGIGSVGQVTQYPFVVDTARNIVGVNGTLVVNGKAIIDNLAAGDISGNKIQAKSITVSHFATDTLIAGNVSGLGPLATKATVAASDIFVGKLSAISSDLGNVNAGSININNKFIVTQDGTTTIQSAATGARVVMSNSLIQVYDANNVLRVKLGVW